MTKQLLCLFVLLVAASNCFGQSKPDLSWLTNEEQNWLAEHPEIVVATNPDFPPFEFWTLNDNGESEFQGVCSSFLEHFSNELGIEFKIIRTRTWDETLKMLRSREVDAVTTMTLSERHNFAAVSKPYISYPGLIFVRTEMQGSVSLDDLSGKRVAVPQHFIGSRFLRSSHPELVIVEVETPAQGVRMLSLGQVDAFFGGSATVSIVARTEGLSNLRISGKSDFYYHQGFGVRDDWAPLATIIGKTIDRMTPTQESNCQTKWIASDFFEPRYYDAAWFWWTSFGAVALLVGSILVLATFNRSKSTKIKNLESIRIEKEAVEEGTIVGSYKLLKKLGRGGMGDVYLAAHVRYNDRLFAIKFLRNELVDESLKSRFEGEIDVLAKLNHPNIVFAQDAGRFGNSSYLVMEYVDGTDLVSIIDKCLRLSVSNASEIIRQAATALDHASDKCVVHRDVKPANLMVSRIGDVKLLDLGLARYHAEGTTQLTATKIILGTPDYMAPEQWGSSKRIDIRADIYSLGCTFFYLLTGRAPFDDENHDSLASKLHGHLKEAPPNINQFVNNTIPEELVGIVNSMLRKAPDDRIQTPAEVAAAVSPYCPGANLKQIPAVQDVEQLNIRALLRTLPTQIENTGETDRQLDQETIDYRE